MVEIAIMVTSITIAIVSLIWSIVAIKKLLDLKKSFNKDIVLVPLFKRSKWTYFSIGLLACAFIADLVLTIVLEEYLIGGCVLVIIASLFALLLVINSLKFAVLETGILMPYKYVTWQQFYDYKVEGNTIFFCGDKKGFDTMFAATTRLTFDVKLKEKLVALLEDKKQNK